MKKIVLILLIIIILTGCSDVVAPMFISRTPHQYIIALKDNSEVSICANSVHEYPSEHVLDFINYDLVVVMHVVEYKYYKLGDDSKCSVDSK
jgi:hypothetical protein